LFAIRKKKKTVGDVSNLRAVVIFCIIMFCIAFCCLQIVLINILQSDTVSEAIISKSLTLGESRGMIYDSEFNKMVCNEYSYISAVKPTVESLKQIRALVDDITYSRAVESVYSQSPFLIKTDCYIKSEEVICEKIYKRYSNNQLAAHLIGYTDSNGKNGICGIELAYDSVLKKYDGAVKSRFFTNGKGSVMLGYEGERINENYNSPGGIVLTIKNEYQRALENAMDKNELNKGAGVVVSIKTGEVAAIASRPNYNPNSISDYIKDSDSSLFNRAFGEYPIGSVFKPLVAASALEQGTDPEDEFYCTGTIGNGSSEFGCTRSHGNVNMATALVFSCNCYFVDLIEKIDYTQVIDLAASLGFGNRIMLDENIGTSSGALPKTDELDSYASRANLSFGQGKISATPFHIANLYAMLANGGDFRKTFLIKGVCDGQGNFDQTYELKPPYKLISEKNAELLCDILELAVREGTGQSAKVSGINVAGKTATAQSGKFIEGKERLVTWFAGFFPYENPEYVAVIVCEDGESGSKDCAPVFSDFVESLYFKNNL